MIGLDVRVDWTRTATDEVKRDLAQPMAIAAATARIMQARTRKGEFATAAKPFAERATAGPRKHKSYYLSPTYAVAAGLGAQTRWRSSAEMHRSAGAIAGAGDVTGKMWAGLRVNNFGEDAVIVWFSGSSLGAKSTRTVITKRATGSYEVTLSESGKLRARQMREISRDEGGAVKYRRKPTLVRNRLKASAVFQHNRIGLLQPTESEEAAILAAFRHHADIICRGRLGLFLTDTTTRPAGVDNRLYDAILSGFRK